MRAYIHYFCLASIFFILSCNARQEQDKLRLIVVDEVTFETDSLVPINPITVQFLETDSGSQLFTYNYFEKNFQFYAYPTGELVQEVPLYLDGPNSIRPFSGGTLTNKDSIWIVNNMPTGIILINFDGEVLLKRPIENPLFPITYLNVSQRNPLYQIGNKVYGPQPLFMKHHDMEKEDIQKHHLVYSYDILEDTVQWYDVFYREDYWDQGKKISEFSWARREDKIYIAPWHNHEIQVFDTQSGTVINRKEVRSEKINRFHIVNELAANRREGLESRLKYDRYGTLIYDPYRDIFYRLTLPAVEYDPDAPDEEINNLNYYRPYTGIMVLDKDLIVLGEHTFGSFEVYAEYNFFVREEGLYLSQNNLFHPDYDEGKFRYLVVRFEAGDQ